MENGGNSSSVEVAEIPIYQNGTKNEISANNFELQNGTKNGHEKEDYDTNIGRLCLAKWSDKKYYPGFVNNINKGPKNSKKYEIIYEDGHRKVVAESLIVFGDFNSPILPVLNQSVSFFEGKNVVVGLCVEIIRSETEEKPKYQILTDTGTEVCSAGDLFLSEDQVKMIKGTYKHNSSNYNGVRRSGRKRNGRDMSPQPGPSGLCFPKRSKKVEKEKQQQVDSDDSEYLSDPEPEPIKKRNLWDLEGVQTELQTTQLDQDVLRKKLEEEYESNLETILGKLSENNRIFRGKGFLITCTYPLNDKKKSLVSDKISQLPFLRSHLENQIRAAGGVVYQSFESVPKNKYKMCRLIAPYPCSTPKYIQCLAAGIPILSHQFIVDCSNESKLFDFKNYILPSGYSILQENYLDWKTDRNVSHRKQFLPFRNSTIAIGSFENDFVEFWSKVCKLAGATVRIAKRTEDFTPTLNGYLLVQEDFFCRNRAKVEYFNSNLPVVSTTFIVESLICGNIVDHNASHLFKEPFEDEDEPDVL